MTTHMGRGLELPMVVDLVVAWDSSICKVTLASGSSSACQQDQQQTRCVQGKSVTCSCARARNACVAWGRCCSLLPA